MASWAARGVACGSGCRHGLAPPHPRGRRELLQSSPRPALAEGAAHHGAHLARAHSDDARGRTPTATQPDSRLPPG
eukprot:10410333-Alexandrium_andersonii.AAC.1